jgi:hypothetical protein
MSDNSDLSMLVMNSRYRLLLQNVGDKRSSNERPMVGTVHEIMLC